VKSSSLSRRINERIRQRGPISVAAFMDLALYDPDAGYYARAAQRSGRAGDFFTSVDVGPLFGELLERQIAEMADILAGTPADPKTTADVPRDFRPPAPSGVVRDFRPPAPSGVVRDFSPALPFDLVEAGAGNGRLAADILRAAKRRDPALYDRLRLHLVEASAEARAAQTTTLGELAERLASSSTSWPERFDGVLVANELLDAFPVHQVVMREEGLREVYVGLSSPGGEPNGAELTLVEGPLSSPALLDYLQRLGVRLESGWRAEINLRAAEWIHEAAARLTRGFIILIDYGHDAHQLYSASHADGTLTTFARHTMDGPAQAPVPPWLRMPGERDITAHVDFTTVRAAAEAAGLETLLFVDQTYFVMGMLHSLGSSGSANTLGSARALKTLLMPGGLGSTHKVLILGKAVGTPPLMGGSFGGRVT
jgi:SAM-dependent MidA family methyltransferase